MTEEGNRPPSTALLYSLLVLMVSFWALNFVVARITLREFPPLLAASLRAFLAGLFLLPLYLWKGRQQDKEPWSRRDMPYLLSLGVLGVTFNQVLFLLGLNRTSNTHAAIITGLMPLQVMVISMISGLERTSLKRLLGMAVAIGGVGILQTAREPGGQATLIGDALILLSGTSFAIFVILSKKLTTKHGGLTINTFAFFGGGMVLIPGIVWQLRTFDLTAVTVAGWSSLAYMAIFPSAIAYLIFYWALTYIPASRVSNFSYLQPVLATIFSVLMLSDHVTGTLVAGGTLVLTGVFLTERG
ncbi:MAG: EamA family transporter [Candidatus Solibacter usitatus]|nr:EamA family transporter [Candidatus Solibacter usitatus]